MAFAVSSGGALEDFSGKNQDAASFNRFAAASVCTEAVYSLHSMQLLMLLLFVGSYVLLMALAGLFVGVKMSTLTWTNEIVPIKQGGAVMVTLFGGFGYVILLFAGFMLLPGWILGFCGYISCFVGVNLLLSVWACLWLRKKGAARFSAL